MAQVALLHCPLRGQLRVPERARDRLVFSEEKRRIDAIRFLLQRGYPNDHFDTETTVLRFGHKGRSSFRLDFSVYDEPAENFAGAEVEERVPHIKLAAEIKRDNASANQAKATQIKPALRLLPDLSALGVYWDDLEQRFFYRTLDNRKTRINEAPIARIPRWGDQVASLTLSYPDLQPSKELPRIFDQLEDLLHHYVPDKSKRYSIIFQLLLLKIHDESRHRNRPDQPLDLQDFSVSPLADKVILARFSSAIKKASAHYQQYLPKPIASSFKLPAEALRRASTLLAPITILESRKEVIQAFYMRFAKNLYKWDLAQYFTPHEVIDFIIEVVNPTYGLHVKDPACGSADFLISAFRSIKRFDSNAGQCIWGSDNSEQAVQISVLNMLLNGDGKTNVKEEDSLRDYDPSGRQYDIVVCNPPFGTKILETRPEVLAHFNLGHEWVLGERHRPEKTDQLRKSQQAGILFAELCVRLAKDGGRIGIILPNGYLGNASPVYRGLREWLLRNTRLVGIVGFPRFTFKKSGADVSASVVFLEKRRKPLKKADESEDYSFFVAMAESVGWRVGDKKGVPLYRREMATGALLFDRNNEPVLDSDFSDILDEMLTSPASNCFPWLLEERELPNGAQGWGRGIKQVAATPLLNLDPKRMCRKFVELQQGIRRDEHFYVGEVAEVVESEVTLEKSQVYRYVEIQNVGVGEFDFQQLRGWQLPDRAKLCAKKGDIFLANIWSCVGKWFMAGEDCDQLIVTNGCKRLRIRTGKKALLPDLIAGLCSENFRIQMRALATGSDGLADVSDDDLRSIVLPKLRDSKARHRVLALIRTLMKGELRLSKAMSRVVCDADGWTEPPARENHWILV